MSTLWRRVLLVLGLFGLAGGCNPLYLPFFLMSPEPKFPPSYKQLASEDKKKEVRVVILTDMGIHDNYELVQADREIGRRFAQRLQELCKYNEEKVTVVNPLKVEEYKNAHPDWNQVGELEEVGKHFQADYVIHLEIGALQLYQPDTGRTLYQGKANMNVTLVDVNKPDDFSTPPKEFNISYPTESRGGNIPVDADMPLPAFRSKFFDHVARQLSWQFTAHPTNQHNWCE